MNSLLQDERITKGIGGQQYSTQPLVGVMDSNPSDKKLRIGDIEFHDDAVDGLLGMTKIDKRYGKRLLADKEYDPLSYLVNYNLNRKSYAADALMINGLCRGIVGRGQQIMTPDTIVHTIDEVLSNIEDDTVEVVSASFGLKKSHIDLKFPGIHWNVADDGEKDDYFDGGLAIDWSPLQISKPMIRGYLGRRICANGMITDVVDGGLNFDSVPEFIGGLSRIYAIASNVGDQVDNIRHMRTVVLSNPVFEARQLCKDMGLSNYAITQVLANINQGSPGSDGPVQTLYDLHNLVTHSANLTPEFEARREIQYRSNKLVRDAHLFETCDSCHSIIPHEHTE